MTTVLGPVGLGVLLAYFYQYQLNSIDIQNLCRAIILPISSVLVFIQTNTISFDELSEVTFTASNSSLSGNFGPNQVSIMMGIGSGILLYSVFFGIKIFKYKLLDYAVLGLCVFRGLLTFSRGGVTVPFIAFALIILLSFVRAFIGRAGATAHRARIGWPRFERAYTTYGILRVHDGIQ
jgi:hypothetical protein